MTYFRAGDHSILDLKRVKNRSSKLLYCIYRKVNMSGADSSSSYFDNVDFLDDPYAFARQDTDKAGSSSKQSARRDETGKRGSGQQARRERRERLNGRDNEGRGGGGSAMDVDGPGTRGVVDGMGAGDSRESEQNDVQRLMRAWQDERHAPDILPAQDELLGRVLDSIRQQVCRLICWWFDDLNPPAKWFLL